FTYRISSTGYRVFSTEVCLLLPGLCHFVTPSPRHPVARSRFSRGLSSFSVILPLALALSLFSLGCHSLKLSSQANEKPEKADKEPALVAPSKYQLRVSQYLFRADFELKPELPLFRELADLRDQVHKEFQLPAANTIIQVHLFEDQHRYENFMHARYPDLPRRRAFFVAQPPRVGGAEDLLVYTFWGDRIRQDLRHELTHALLH